ncbi:hypothetical protein PSP6_470060 [Paraburkholderia tropica]|nr:hypothetical protein PSP6_470060 [Paraburkholderia tropica]
MTAIVDSLCSCEGDPICDLYAQVCRGLKTRMTYATDATRGARSSVCLFAGFESEESVLEY